MMTEFRASAGNPAKRNIYNINALNISRSASSTPSPTNLHFEISPKRSNAVDISFPENKVESLLTCSSLNDFTGWSDTLFLDLSIHGQPVPLPNVHYVHLSFPSTLVRRPKFQVPQLLKTLSAETQQELTELIRRCEQFIFYDELSTMNHCSLNTFLLLSKFVTYLKQQKQDGKFYFLQGGASVFQQLEASRIAVSTPLINASKQSVRKRNKPKINLKLTIPPKDNKQESSSRMFIQSIKKDAVHYSPNSLKKYFTFHIPTGISTTDTLPTWLKPFTKNNDENLLKILDGFELLEKLEVKRLERCLLSVTPSTLSTSLESQGPSPGTASPLPPLPKTKKLYSFRQLQRQFQPNRHDYDSDNDGYTQSKNKKLEMDIKEELNDGENSEILTKLKKFNKELITTNASPPITDQTEVEDEDVAETPLDNYLMTQGIQSFTKNRYSNILPYEHSRVKLEPSPVWPDRSSAQKWTPNVTTPSTEPVSTSARRKRRNSYFSQDLPQMELQKQIPPNMLLLKPPQPSKCETKTSAASQGEPFNDYFNANYLKLPQINPDYNYIATQAPLPSTVDDFWKVIVSNNVHVIVSLNSDDELNLRKWDIYWNNGSLRKFDVQVEKTFKDVGGVDGCILRVFKVRRSPQSLTTTNENLDEGDLQVTNGNVTRSCSSPTKKFKTFIPEENDSVSNHAKDLSVHTVYQLQYTKWLDSCGVVMKDVLQLYRMKRKLMSEPQEFIKGLENGFNYDEMMESDEHHQSLTINRDSGSHKRPPVLVHCSAGCGRTGVFITLDFLLNVLESPTDKCNRIDVWNMSQDLIFIIVNELRKQRISMVQNLTQYITCYESILEYFAFRGKNIEKKTDG